MGHAKIAEVERAIVLQTVRLLQLLAVVVHAQHALRSFAPVATTCRTDLQPAMRACSRSRRLGMRGLQLRGQMLSSSVGEIHTGCPDSLQGPGEGGACLQVGSTLRTGAS